MDVDSTSMPGYNNTHVISTSIESLVRFSERDTIDARNDLRYACTYYGGYSMLDRRKLLGQQGRYNY